MNTPDTKIALQLYTVRDFLKTPEDVESSFQKIRDIGYKAVELAGLTCLDDAELQQLLERYGLFCCSMHVRMAGVTDELEATIRKMQMLGCPHVAVSWSGPEYRTIEGVKNLAQQLHDAGKTLSEHGLKLSYHNHKFEFEKLGSKVMLKHLYDLSAPQYLSAQLDLCWIQMSGASPVTWIRQMAGRNWSIHYKDVTIKNDEQVLTEVGEGNLDWPEIIRASEEVGAQFYVVEQDRCERDPFESANISYQNLRNLGVH
jgi:sugar phosphate isomerase/epimerase